MTAADIACGIAGNKNGIRQGRMPLQAADQQSQGTV
jgi:hypothetical protein